MRDLGREKAAVNQRGKIEMTRQVLAEQRAARKAAAHEDPE
jgi:hypothetical protein